MTGPHVGEGEQVARCGATAGADASCRASDPEWASLRGRTDEGLEVVEISRGLGSLALAPRSTLGSAMGAWGPGSFDNDAALDWAQDVVESAEPAHAVSHALDAMTDALRASRPRLADANLGCRVLVAGELLAASAGFPHPRLVADGEGDWLSSFRLPFDGALAQRARQALQVIVDPNRSELAVLWVHEDAGEPDAEWLREIDDLAARLDRALERPGPRVPRIGLSPLTGSVRTPEESRRHLDREKHLQHIFEDTQSITGALLCVAASDPEVAGWLQERSTLRVIALVRSALRVPLARAAVLGAWTVLGDDAHLDDAAVDRSFLETNEDDGRG